MNTLARLPVRQKILLSLTIVTGLLFLMAYHASLISKENLDITIFLYGLSVPLSILIYDTLIDLDKTAIFNTWAIIGVAFLVIYFMTRNDPNLFIRSNTLEGETNKIFFRNSTAPLKALPVFLLVYRILNSIIKKRTGNFIVNTYHQGNWYHDIAKRKIRWYDVLANILLFAIIVCASLFDF